MFRTTEIILREGGRLSGYLKVWLSDVPREGWGGTGHLFFSKEDIEIACVLEQESCELDLGTPCLAARLQVLTSCMN